VIDDHDDFGDHGRVPANYRLRTLDAERI